MEEATIKGKRIEFIIGIILLTPPILGALLFFLCLCGINDSFVRMVKLSPAWTGLLESGGFTSAAPIYLGLTALAGAYLIKDSVKYLYMKDSK